MKTKIIEQMGVLAKGAGLESTKSNDEGAFKLVFDAVKAVVERDGEARIPGFGTFKKKHREGRSVRNPRTGETVMTAAKDVIVFKQSKVGG